MNQVWNQFLSLSVQQQQDVFEAAAEDLDTRSTYIEKDFWVSLILDIFYNGLTENHPRILFKGGTSLSKVYGLIQRFSEDVDFTIFAEDLGFIGDLDPNSDSISNKKKKKLSEEVIEKTANYIGARLKNNLENIILKLPVDCSISIDEQDPSTLLWRYPSLFVKDNDSYIDSVVKLEGGGRSAVDPHQKYLIQPLIASTLPDWDFSVGNVITIDAQRTFWDKVFILHGLYYGYKDENRIPADRQRLSRHYYDTAMIYNSDIGKQAVKNDQLREKVRQHKISFFNAAWKKFDLAVPGSLKIVPYDNLLLALKRDYQSMAGMMLGDVPNFEEILNILHAMEIAVNNLQ